MTEIMAVSAIVRVAVMFGTVVMLAMVSWSSVMRAT